MIRFLLSRLSVFGLIVSLSGYSSQAQTVTDDKSKPDIIVADNTPPSGRTGTGSLGKEIPVAGGVLYVTQSETNSLEKEKSDKVKRIKKQRRQDRKEVTRVIGNSVNTYLANVYNVHTLQRF